MNAPERHWLDVGLVIDIPRRGARRVETPWMDIAIFRTMDDRVFALEDRCPHRNGPLSQGIVHGAHVTCPLHNQVIGLESGRVQAPDHGCVTSLPVRVVDGRVALGLPLAVSGD